MRGAAGDRALQGQEIVLAVAQLLSEGVGPPLEQRCRGVVPREDAQLGIEHGDRRAELTDDRGDPAGVECRRQLVVQTR
jgi:hypothetical protein